MLSEPIKLTLYDDKNEPIQEYKCFVIPWGLLKKALSFQSFITNKAEAEEIDVGIIDAIGTFVCDLYRNQFTLEELNAGADMGEVMDAVTAVVAHAGAMNPNA